MDESSEDRPATRWAASLAASLLLGVFMVPFNWWAWSGGGPWPVLVFVGLGDLIVFAVLLSFLYRLLQHLKYGRTRLSFAQFPYAPGGRLLVGLSPNRFTQLDVTLRFVTEAFVARGTGRHRSVVHESRAAWAERHTVVANPTQREVELDFALPDQPGWVNRLAADPGIQYWELLVEARRPGIDFRTTFPLPVYDADRSVATIGTSCCSTYSETTLCAVQTVSCTSTNTIERDPFHMRHVDSALENKIFEKSAHFVVNDGCCDCGPHSETPAKPTSDVVFAPALPDSKIARCPDTSLARIKTNHNLAERNKVPPAFLFRLYLQN